MKNKCSNCGASEFTLKDGYSVCKYCGSRLVVQNTNGSSNNGIGLDDDVEILLQKCKSDPKNAKKYANLILDIDPTNEIAARILRR